MTTPIDTLQSLSPAAARAVPALADDLADMLHAVRALDALGIARGPHLSHDLDNLATGLAGVLDLERVGHTSPEQEASRHHTHRLIASIRQRAHAAIGQKATGVAIHTEVSARRAPENPKSVTTRLRVLAAAPSPIGSDAPGHLSSITDLWKDQPQAYGRISGEHTSLSADIPQDDLGFAPREAVVLPPGMAAQFAPQDTFFLYAQGAQYLHHSTQPPKDATGERMFIEAGEQGVLVHGPAVLLPTPQHTGVLTRIKGAEYIAMNTASTISTIRTDLSKREDCARDRSHALAAPWGIGSVVGIFGGSLGTILLNAMAPGIPTLAFLTYAAILSCWVFGIPAFVGYSIIAQKWHAYKRRRTIAGLVAATNADPRQQAAYEDLVGVLSTATQGATHRTLTRTLYSQVPDNIPAGPCTRYPKRVDLHAGTGLNAWPIARIDCAHPDHIKVLRPLLALPAPDATHAPAPQGAAHPA